MPLHDLRIAARVLRKNPVFSLTAALTIALGVGASTAIFAWPMPSYFGRFLTKIPDAW